MVSKWNKRVPRPAISRVTDTSRPVRIGTSMGKGMVKIIPIILGVIISYIAAIFMGEVDLSAISEEATDQNQSCDDGVS